MRVGVVLLSTFAVALCAPTGEKADALEIESDDMRGKYMFNFSTFYFLHL